MKRNILLIGLSALVMLGSAAPAQQAASDANVLKLTLDETIVRALKNNLNVAAEVITPGLASASVSRRTTIRCRSTERAPLTAHRLRYATAASSSRSRSQLRYVAMYASCATSSAAC